MWFLLFAGELISVVQGEYQLSTYFFATSRNLLNIAIILIMSMNYSLS